MEEAIEGTATVRSACLVDEDHGHLEPDRNSQLLREGLSLRASSFEDDDSVNVNVPTGGSVITARPSVARLSKSETIIAPGL